MPTMSTERERAAEVLAPFADRELIDLPSLAARLSAVLGIGFGKQARKYAIKYGVINPAAERGPNGRYQVTPAEAELITRAAIKALLTGIAIVTVLRILAAGNGTT
jgi:hypothetical protein